jgi:hypothetical protein
VTAGAQTTGAATTTGATGAATTTGTGNGRPNPKPKRTPAWAERLAAPISAAVRSSLVFIIFISFVFLWRDCHSPNQTEAFGESYSLGNEIKGCAKIAQRERQQVTVQLLNCKPDFCKNIVKDFPPALAGSFHAQNFRRTDFIAEL